MLSFEQMQLFLSSVTSIIKFNTVQFTSVNVVHLPTSSSLLLVLNARLRLPFVVSESFRIA